MILSADALIAMYPAVAAQYHRVAVCNPADVRRCCIRAMALAHGDPALEPAAIFFALADKRRAFPFAWKLMAGNAAAMQAIASGYELTVPVEDLGPVCTDVLFKRALWPDVQAWFASRLRSVR